MKTVRVWMYQWVLVTLMVGSTSFAQRGDGPGSHGDPLQFEVYNRAKFGLEKIKENKMLPGDQISLLEKAVDRLIVDVDTTLTGKTEVRPDPKRDGRRVVFVNPEKMEPDLKHRKDALDLTQHSIHEAFQVLVDENDRPFDLDEEWTKNLHFNEKEYEQWRVDHINSSVATEAGPDATPLIGYYFSKNGVFTETKIEYRSAWDDFTLSDVRKRTSRPFDKTFGPDAIELKFKEVRKGRSVWEAREPVGFRNDGCPCVWDYYVELTFQQDGFFLKEKYPRNVKWDKDRGTGPSACSPSEDDLRAHTHEYRIGAGSLWKAYERAAQKKDLSEERKMEWELFQAVAQGEAEKVRNLLEAGVSPKITDWRNRTPLMIAAWIAKADVLELLLPVSDLNAQDNDGLTVYTHATNDVGRTVSEEVVIATLQKLLTPETSRANAKSVFAYLSVRPAKYTADILTSTNAKNINDGLVELMEGMFASDSYNPAPEVEANLILALQGELSGDLVLANTTKWALRIQKDRVLSLLMSKLGQQQKDKVVLDFAEALEKNSGLKMPEFLTAMVKNNVSPAAQTRVLGRLITTRQMDEFKRLQELGAPLTGTDFKGQTIPMYLASANYLDWLKYVASLEGVDLNAKNLEGTTALGFAVANGSYATVIYLVDKCDVNATMGPKKTPLIAIAAQGLAQYPRGGMNCYNCRKQDLPKIPEHFEVIKLLVEKGAVLNAADTEGYIAFDYVIQAMAVATRNFTHFGRDPEWESHLDSVFHYFQGKGAQYNKIKPPKHWHGLGITVTQQPVQQQPVPQSFPSSSYKGGGSYSGGYAEPVPAMGGRGRRGR